MISIYYCPFHIFSSRNHFHIHIKKYTSTFLCKYYLCKISSHYTKRRKEFVPLITSAIHHTQMACPQVAHNKKSSKRKSRKYICYKLFFNYVENATCIKRYNILSHTNCLIMLSKQTCSVNYLDIVYHTLFQYYDK